MHVREEDQAQIVRVTRDVPLWSIISALVVVGVQAAALYYGQVRQTELLNTQSSTIKELTAQVQQLSVDITKSNLKAVEYDFRIGDLSRRVQQLETNSFNRIPTR